MMGVSEDTLKDVESNNDELYYGKFPSGFLFGSSTISHQIEGAYACDGKGLSIWDEFSNLHPKYIRDRSTANEACNSYRQFEEDVIMLKCLNANAYSFSLSWCRILPDGEKINQAGIAFYDVLLNTLLENGIEPIVTLYYWDLPQALLEKYVGGWMNGNLITAFEYYASICFQRFGDRVKRWVTIAQPWEHSWKSYGAGVHPPNISLGNKGAFLSNTNLLKAHAKVYRIYEKIYKPLQNGKVGISLDYREGDDVHIDQLGPVLYPISHGEYPKGDTNNCFCPKTHQFGEWSNLLKGSFDYLVLQYSSEDSAVRSEMSPAFASVERLHKSTLLSLLRTIKTEYMNPEIFIVCKGPCLSSTYQMMDIDRAQYFSYISSEILKAIDLHGCNIRGFFPGKLMDCWEWENGFTISFGLFHVDLFQLHKKRSPRASVAFMLKQLFKEKQLKPVFQL